MANSNFINPTPVDQKLGNFIVTQQNGVENPPTDFVNVSNTTANKSAVYTATNFINVQGAP